MGCGGASKQTITAPGIERQLPAEPEVAAKGEDRNSVVPPLPLGEIPRPVHPLPPQPPDLGKSSPSMSDLSSVKPVSPPRALPSESISSDFRKPLTPPSKIDPEPQKPTHESMTTESIPAAVHSSEKHSVPPVLPPSTEPETLQAEVLRSFRAGNTSPSIPKPGKLELSPGSSERKAEEEKQSVVKPVAATGGDSDGLYEEVLRSAKGDLPSPPLSKPGKLELSPYDSARAEPNLDVEKRPIVQPMTVPSGEEDGLNEEVLRSGKGVKPSSPPPMKPGQLELETPKEPFDAFSIPDVAPTNPPQLIPNLPMNPFPTLTANPLPSDHPETPATISGLIDSGRKSDLS